MDVVFFPWEPLRLNIFTFWHLCFFPPWLGFHQLLDEKCSISSFHYFQSRHVVSRDFQNLFQVIFLVSGFQELQENSSAPSSHPKSRPLARTLGYHSWLKMEGLKPWSKPWHCTGAHDLYKQLASLGNEFMNLIQLDFYRGGKK